MIVADHVRYTRLRPGIPVRLRWTRTVCTGSSLMINRGSGLAVKLSQAHLTTPKQLVNEEKMVYDERVAWSEHGPSAQQENDFIRLHGWDTYAKWYLSVDDEQHDYTKGRYKFPLWRFCKCPPLWPSIRRKQGGQSKYQILCHRKRRRPLALDDRENEAITQLRFITQTGQMISPVW